jgi:cyclopropane-fatty-acyl-phospholipid synthase
MQSSPHTSSLKATMAGALLSRVPVPFELQFANGETVKNMESSPRFKIRLRDDRILGRIRDEFSFADAYVHGQLDIEGDLFAVFDLRDEFKDKFRLSPWFKFWSALLLLDPTRINRSAIAFHYEYGDDFFLNFTDSKYHLYSHGLFEHDDESLERASERKLQNMFDSLQLKAGMRLLDIGAGWGAVTRFCAPRGVEVTSLTLAKNSRDHINGLLSELNAPGQVILEDFLVHRPQKPYDAITILGVIEHIPAYRRFFEQVWACLKPGGRFYLDASADKRKYRVSQFIRKYIYSGTHSNMALQDVIRELIYNGLHLVRVVQESHSYHLTMRHWAERFDTVREQIVRQYGEPLWRAFRLYLWGGSHAFEADILQAYHLVAVRGDSPGPRPGLAARTLDFVREQF